MNMLSPCRGCISFAVCNGKVSDLKNDRTRLTLKAVIVLQLSCQMFYEYVQKTDLSDIFRHTRILYGLQDQQTTL